MAFCFHVGVQKLVGPGICATSRIVDPEVKASISQAVCYRVLGAVAADSGGSGTEAWLEEDNRALLGNSGSNSLRFADSVHGVDIPILGSVGVTLERVTEVSDHLAESLCFDLRLINMPAWYGNLVS